MDSDGQIATEGCRETYSSLGCQVNQAVRHQIMKGVKDKISMQGTERKYRIWIKPFDCVTRDWAEQGYYSLT